MARGILTGIAAGVVVAGLGLGTASMVLGPVEMPSAGPEPAPQMPAEDPAAPEAVPGSDGAEQPQAPGVAQEEPTPPDAPGAGPEASAPIQEESGETPAGPASQPEAGADVPQDPVAGTQPDDAEVAGETSASTGQAETGDAADPGAQPDARAGDAVDDRRETGTGDDDGAASVTATPEPEPEAPETEPQSPDLAAEARDGVEPADDAAPPAPSANAEAPPAEPAVETPDAADTALPEAEAEPEPAAPAVPVVTGRLPAIGGDAAQEPSTPDRIPAIERNAIPFTAPGDLPLMAILLIDTAADRADFADLGKLPFPVTVVVDAGALDAAEATAFYRDQGLEVVTILPLPEGATAADIEINLEAYAPLLENSVAAMAEEALGFQGLGDGAVQLAVNLAESGHGLVSFPSGLNTGHKAAQKEGVPAGLVFRDLDAEGQGGPVIRRFLDNAAFRARNESQVIVVARTREETVQALLEWSLGTRATAVTLAPISALLATE